MGKTGVGLIVWGCLRLDCRPRNPEAQTGLILSAGLGKLCAIVVWSEMLISGYGALLMLAGIIVDGFLGIMFLLYILSLRAVHKSVD